MNLVHRSSNGEDGNGHLNTTTVVEYIITPTKYPTDSSSSSTSSSPSSSSSLSQPSTSYANTTSLALEWDLICDREYLVNLTEVFFFVGCIIGCTFCGYLSDKFGRRATAMTSGLLAAFVGVFVLWVPNLPSYCVLRFLLGIAFTGLSTMAS